MPDESAERDRIIRIIWNGSERSVGIIPRSLREAHAKPGIGRFERLAESGPATYRPLIFHENPPVVWVDTWTVPTVQKLYNIACFCCLRHRNDSPADIPTVREWRNWQTRET
jgi:hypothetical protein